MNTRHPDNPPHRVLVLADNVSATQVISFGQALGKAVATGAVELTMASDDKRWDEPAAREAFWNQHRPTVLVLSRYSNARALAFQALARQRQVPSLFHIDDDLLDVPMSLGRAKYDAYHQPERLAALRAALNGADQVYASTAPLAQRLVAHGVSAPVLAGDLYCSIEPEHLPQPLPATCPVIGYMGTGGHSQDLAMVMPALVRLMAEMPSLRFETFGTIKPPAEMAAFDARYAHHAGVADYAGFVDRLCGLGWWIGIAPLEDNDFNRCKADTKWVEYSFAGMAVVASDLPVYARACSNGGGMAAATVDDWYHALGRLLRDGRARRCQVEQARAHLRSHYTHGVLQAQLLRILADVVMRHGQ